MQKSETIVGRMVRCVWAGGDPVHLEAVPQLRHFVPPNALSFLIHSNLHSTIWPWRVDSTSVVRKNSVSVHDAVWIYSSALVEAKTKRTTWLIPGSVCDGRLLTTLLFPPSPAKRASLSSTASAVLVPEPLSLRHSADELCPHIPPRVVNWRCKA